MAPGLIGRRTRRGGGGGGAAVPPLIFLLAVEALWAFAFYSVQTTLTLYLTAVLSDPAWRRRIWGLALYQSELRRWTGASTPLAVASATYGLFSAAAYTLPMLGAVFGAMLGRGRTLLIALIVLAGGHLLLSSQTGFLLGLGVIAAGVGLLKSNLVSLISREGLKSKGSALTGFGGYVLAANLGSLSAPLICGTLAERVGWPASFLAGASAIIAAFVFALFASSTATKAQDAAELDAPAQSSTNSSNPGAYGKIALLLSAEALFFTAYNQAFNVFPIWARDHLNRTIAGFKLPVTWFSSLDGALTIVGSLLALRLWARSQSTGAASDGVDSGRLLIGALLGCAGFAILSFAAARAAPAPLLAAVSFFALIDLAIPWVDAVVLAGLAKLSSAKTDSFVFAAYFLSVALASLATGWIGRFYDDVGPSPFFALNAAIVALVVVVAAGLKRLSANPSTPRLQRR